MKKMAYHDTVTNKMTADHKEAVEWSRLGHKIDLYKYREEYDDYVYVTNWTVEYEQAETPTFLMAAGGRWVSSPACRVALFVYIAQIFQANFVHSAYCNFA